MQRFRYFIREEKGLDVNRVLIRWYSSFIMLSEKVGMGINYLFDGFRSCFRQFCFARVVFEPCIRPSPL